jgi:hypothetical protein
MLIIALMDGSTQRGPLREGMMGGENSPMEIRDQFAFTLLSTW